MWKIILAVLAYIWQLPQNIMGIILRLFYKQDYSLWYKDRIIRVCKHFPGGISLGNNVIVKKYPYNTETWNTVKHEWGHTRQSLYLGPMYLLVVGLPSLTWAMLHGNVIKNKDYYSFWTEAWADKLGNVKR